MIVDIISQLLTFVFSFMICLLIMFLCFSKWLYNVCHLVFVLVVLFVCFCIFFLVFFNPFSFAIAASVA